MPATGVRGDTDREGIAAIRFAPKGRPYNGMARWMYIATWIAPTRTPSHKTDNPHGDRPNPPAPDWHRCSAPPPATRIPGAAHVRNTPAPIPCPCCRTPRLRHVPTPISPDSSTVATTSTAQAGSTSVHGLASTPMPEAAHRPTPMASRKGVTPRRRHRRRTDWSDPGSLPLRDRDRQALNDDDAGAPRGQGRCRSDVPLREIPRSHPRTTSDGAT